MNIRTQLAHRFIHHRLDGQMQAQIKSLHGCHYRSRGKEQTMSDDTINRKEAINAVLRNLNEEEYRSSWESGAVKVMKDTLEKMPTEDRPVNGVLFKGRLEEGDYTLIKTTDGWVLKGKTSYVGFKI